MSFILEEIIYASGMLIGLGCRQLVLMNRGSYTFNEATHTNESTGGGLSQKISQYWPYWKEISSGVDHFLEGIGGVLGVGGTFNLFFTGLMHSGLNDPGQMMIAYGWGLAGFAARKLYRLYYEFHGTGRKFGIGDLYQIIGDVGGLAVSYGLMYGLANAIY